MILTSLLFPIVFVASFQDGEKRVLNMPAIGYYKRDYVFAFGNPRVSKTAGKEEISNLLRFGPPRVLKTGLSGKGEISDYYVDMYAPPRVHRFSFVYDCLWVSGTSYNCSVRRIPEKDLPYYDMRDESAEKCWAKEPKQLRQLVDSHLFVLGPVLSASGNEGMQAAEKGELGGFRPQRFDFMPTSAITAKLFLFFPKTSRLGVWGAKLRWLEQHKRWDLDFNEREEESFPSSFSEDFYVFAKGTTYFFLARSGHLYYAAKPKKGEREMKRAWTKTEPPISAVVTDATTGTTYFFGKLPWERTKRFYFELAERPQPQFFLEKDLKVFEGEEPLKTVVEYARVLADRKKETNKK